MKFFARPKVPVFRPALPAGTRLYAIGDIHGRLDLLDNVLAMIRTDAATYPYTLIFLGDYIDRGFQSRDVIDRLLELKNTPGTEHTFLLGNHEQILREILKYKEPQLLHDWLKFGGRETALSYGVPLPVIHGAPEAFLESLASLIPDAHKTFLNTLDLTASSGGYFFCHAGVKPGIALENQSEKDLLWIRQEFLGHTGAYGKVVVHGHTISPEVERLPNRINLDTGAYATGKLTALGLEAGRQWILQTGM